ncbi:MAG: NAD(P)-dependent oxidoreductase [Pseudomonadota bacterium]
MVKFVHTVAITGASGYIGKHLVAQLRQLGDVRIKVLSRSSRRVGDQTKYGAGVEVTVGDLHLPASLQGFLEPDCTVVHLAYLQSGGEADNLRATATLVEACRSVGVRRLIHCSTAAVVGRTSDDTVTEETPCKPYSEYGVTKLKIEQAILQASDGAFDIVVLRPTSVFGPEGGSLKKLVADLIARKNFRNYLKSCLFARRRMNLVHVDNVVASIVFTIRHEQPFGGAIFIVSEDDNPKNNFAFVEQFLMRKLSVSGYQLAPVFLPLELLALLLKVLGRNNLNPRCNYDPRKLLELGFTRPANFETGLEDYAAWYLSASNST